MKERLFLALIILGIISTSPILAANFNKDDEVSLEEIKSLVIDQRGLRQVCIGISIMPVKININDWDGENLVVRVNGKRSFGGMNPISVTFSDKNSELIVSISYVNSSFFGISIGSIDVDILIPDKWKEDLRLKDLKADTMIDGLSIRNLVGNTSLTSLNIRNSNFNKIDMSFGADSYFLADTVDAKIWHLDGSLGKIKAVNVSGEMDVKTMDGDINILFTKFYGTSTLFSKLGKISVEIPKDTLLDLDISSSLDSVETNFPVTGSINDNAENRIKGSVGSSGNSLTVHSGSEKVSVMAISGIAK